LEIPVELLNTIWYICVYSLMAIPLTLSYRISKVLNFAHGVYVTLGAYTAILMSAAFGVKLSPFLAVPAAFLVGASISVLTDMMVFSPLIRRESNPVTLMIASMGAWIFIKNAFYALVDILQKRWMTSLFYTSPNIDLPAQVAIAGVELNTRLLFVVSLSAISLFLLGYFLTKTRLGMALRAIADNLDLAQISGISRERVMLITWLVSGGLAALGGFALSLFTYVSPELGDQMILQVFACSVIGGLTSIPLTFVGAVIISSSENILIVFLYRYLGIELSFRPFLSFFALLSVILIRPPAGAGGGLPYRFHLRGLSIQKKSDS